jgi:hypothetical protein
VLPTFDPVSNGGHATQIPGPTASASLPKQATSNVFAVQFLACTSSSYRSAALGTFEYQDVSKTSQ